MRPFEPSQRPQLGAWSFVSRGLKGKPESPDSYSNRITIPLGKSRDGRSRLSVAFIAYAAVPSDKSMPVALPGSAFEWTRRPVGRLTQIEEDAMQHRSTQPS
jgi:hypothetical protein